MDFSFYFWLTKQRMKYQGLIAAALISLIFTLVSVFFLRKRGPWGSVWTFFLVLFLTLATISIYVGPIGPVYWDVAWIPITVAGFIVTILLIAAMPHPGVGHEEVAIGKDTDSNKADFQATPVGRFFWTLIILFVIAILVGMLNPQVAL